MGACLHPRRSSLLCHTLTNCLHETSDAQVTLYDLNTFVIRPSTVEQRCSFVELITEAGSTEVVRCPHGHLQMTYVAKRDHWQESEATETCDGCGAAECEEHFQCLRCDHKLCAGCAPSATTTVARAKLQQPEFFVSHWYNTSFL